MTDTLRIDLARAYIRARGGGIVASDEHWPPTVSHYLKMCAEHADYYAAHSLVTDAFRDADIAIAFIAAWNRRASAPPADVAGLVDWHRRNATAIYIAVEEAVAKDISAKSLETADALSALAQERDRLREALRWYANDDEVEKFQIVDSKGEVIANFSEFTSRARAALGDRHEPKN